MSRLTDLSLANRALVALVTIVAVVAGIISTMTLKQELIPSLQIPAIFAATPVPGTDSEVVDEQVSQPISAAAQTLDGVKEVQTTSSTGLSVVVVNLDFGADLDKAQTELQQSVAALDLPEGAEPDILAGNFDDFPVIQLSVGSQGDLDELVSVLQRDVIPDLKSIDGVRDVELTGTPSKVAAITLNQRKATAAGVNALSVSTALQSSGVVVPAGELTSGDRSLAVQVGTPLASVAELGKVPIAGANGRTVSLGDVAEVKLTDAPATGYSRTDGEPSVTLAITKTPDGNTVTLSHDVADKLDDYEKSTGASFTTVFDQAPYIEESIGDLATEGGLGLLMAIIIVLIFLLSLRMTLIAALSIPMSLLVAMIGLKVGGYSLNILTLGALTIAIGRVVDDAIVVVENIKRHIDHGESRLRAIPNAVREVAAAITASTLATAAVFAPIGLVGGQVGLLFRPFALTVALALLASLVVALTVVPVFAYWLIKGRGETEEADLTEMPKHPTRTEEPPGRLQRAYLKVLDTALGHKIITLALAAVVFVGTIGLAGLLKTDFLGDQGSQTMLVTQELPAGTSLSALDAAAKKTEAIVQKADGLESYQVTVGDSGDGSAAFTGSGTSTAQFYLTLDEDADNSTVAEELEEALDGKVPGEIKVDETGGGQASTVDVVITAPDDARLTEANGKVLEALKGIDGTKDVSSNLAGAVPGVDVTVDRAKAAAEGLTEQSVGELVAGALRGTPVGQLAVNGGTVPVTIVPGTPVASIEALGSMPVGAGPSGPVTLSQVATVKEVEAPESVTRADGERTATVSLTPAGDDLGAVTADVNKRLDDVDLPEGAEASVGGVSEDQAEAFLQLGLAILAAIALVFMIMVATFRSLVQPLILMVSIPFAATGAILLLLATGVALGIASIIGMLMLVGIVVTNAIVLIDLINQYRNDGLSIRESIEEGGRHRLRPILMTALATIFALLPMAFALTGGGAFISQPLAIVVIGGLLSSTVLTLILVPVLYGFVEDRKEKRAKRREGRRHVKGSKVAATAPLVSSRS